MVEVMSARELPICGATSCCTKKVDKLKVDVTIKTLSTEKSTKGEDV